MARPAKSLQERVRDRSFLARRHGALLAGPLVGPERLREIQRRWQTETNETVRRALEREYEKLVAGNGSVEAAESRAKPLSSRRRGVRLAGGALLPGDVRAREGTGGWAGVHARALAAALRRGVHARRTAAASGSTSGAARRRQGKRQVAARGRAGAAGARLHGRRAGRDPRRRCSRSGPRRLRVRARLRRVGAATRRPAGGTARDPQPAQRRRPAHRLRGRLRRPRPQPLGGDHRRAARLERRTSSTSSSTRSTRPCTSAPAPSGS